MDREKQSGPLKDQDELKKKLLERHDFYFNEVRQNPEAVHLVVSLADTCLALKKRREALIYYKRALLLDPANAYVQNLIQSHFSPDEMKGIVMMPKAKPFWQDFGALLRYPLRKYAFVSVFSGALAAALFNSVPLVGGLVIIIVFPYILAYFFTILQSSARNEIILPTWPDISDIWDNIVRPFIMIMTVLIIGFFPVVIYLLFAIFSHVRLLFLIPAGMVLGVFYTPMALLVAAIYENIFAPFQVRMILTSICKIRSHYLLVLACTPAWILMGWLLMFVIPLEVFLLGPFIFWFVNLYVSIVLARVLGNVYAINADRLGWKV